MRVMLSNDCSSATRELQYKKQLAVASVIIGERLKGDTRCARPAEPESVGVFLATYPGRRSRTRFALGYSLSLRWSFGWVRCGARDCFYKTRLSLLAIEKLNFAGGEVIHAAG